MLPGIRIPGAVARPYQIGRSLKLRANSSARLTRTLASTTDRKKWTCSAWVKITSSTQAGGILMSRPDPNNYSALEFNSGGGIRLIFANAGSVTLRKEPSMLLRDIGSWYHIVGVVDTDNATAEDRALVYVNGQRITAWSINTIPSLGLATGYINDSLYQHSIGYDTNLGYFDGCIAEMHFIDGQALTASSFGQTDATTGSWVPKKYVGTYGTNGFYLPFNDPTTTTTLTQDRSGNGNNWTAVNLSVTAGVNYDSMLDSPTNNYCWLSALPGGVAPVGGGLVSTTGSSSWSSTGSTYALSSGKWYFEAVVNSVTGANYGGLGWRPAEKGLQIASGEYPGSITGAFGAAVSSTALTAYSSGVSGGSITKAYGTDTVLRTAIDFDSGKVWFGDDTAWIGGGDPAAGTTPTYSFTAGTVLMPYVGVFASSTGANFGQRPFSYTVPTGFRQINAANLPTPSIRRGDRYFRTLLYSGNGSTPRTQTGLSFGPDFVWIKARNNGSINHTLWDSARGVGSALGLSSNTADPDGMGTYGGTTAANGYVSALTADGFTTTAGSSDDVYVNDSVTNYVTWCWDEAVSAGFDIVTYTGTGSARTIAHNLGVAPAMIIAKARNSGTSWNTGHRDCVTGGGGFAGVVYLNLTNAYVADTPTWNATAPTSSVFSVGTGGANTNTVTYVAYLFADVPGFSKFGAYTGNGLADGPFQWCGFRPAFVMLKRVDVGNANTSWIMHDNVRSPQNGVTGIIRADTNTAEQNTSIVYVDFLSNGFKIRVAADDAHNQSGGGYIFAAFAEVPFKYANAR